MPLHRRAGQKDDEGESGDAVVPGNAADHRQHDAAGEDDMGDAPPGRGRRVMIMKGRIDQQAAAQQLHHRDHQDHGRNVDRHRHLAAERICLSAHGNNPDPMCGPLAE